MSSQLLHESPQQSPTEEDISRAGAYAHIETGASPAEAKTERQRQKQRVEGPFADDDDDDEGQLGEDEDRRGSYPPTTDEAEEARRIEENLRNWELAEKQRRKAARDSTSTTASTSLLGDVAKRASLLWSNKRSRPPVQGVGTHHIVPTSDEGVAMDEIENDTLGVTTPNSENPFKTPNASTVSLNTPNDSAIMTETSSTDPLATPTKAAFDKRRSKSHPPPKPLDLPEPRSPPPRTGTPHANTPPEPIPPPTIAAAEIHEEELPEKRWWTDWLCGCRERQEDQAARTNPFE